MGREPQLLTLGLKITLSALLVAAIAGAVGVTLTVLVGIWAGALGLFLVALVFAVLIGAALGSRVGQRVRSLSEFTSTLSYYSPRATQAMTDLQDGLDGLQGSMSRVSELADRVREVEEMAALITGVAQQTHLLAINATMEAARAGESGRGFALVAGEFRRLAEGTEESAERVTALARGLLSDMDKVISSLRGSIADVGHGRDDAARAAAELDRLAQDLNDAMARVTLGLGFEPSTGAFTLERVDNA